VFSGNAGVNPGLSRNCMRDVTVSQIPDPEKEARHLFPELQLAIQGCCYEEAFNSDGTDSGVSPALWIISSALGASSGRSIMRC